MICAQVPGADRRGLKIPTMPFPGHRCWLGPRPGKARGQCVYLLTHPGQAGLNLPSRPGIPAPPASGLRSPVPIPGQLADLALDLGEPPAGKNS
jgi:hypothetical protein